jgi:transitional endoplasmic reticulum ATPase
MDDLDLIINKNKKLIEELSILLKLIKETNMIFFGITSSAEIDSNLKKIFDDEVSFDYPNENDRLDLINEIIKTFPISKDIDIKSINLKLSGYSNSEIIKLFKNAFNKLSGDEKIIKELLINNDGFQNVKLNDIGGLDDVKKRLEEMIIWPLIHEEKYKKLNLKVPSGIVIIEKRNFVIWSSRNGKDNDCKGE